MTGAQPPTRAYQDVTRASDGRSCVAFIRGELNRKSFSLSAEQIGPEPVLVNATNVTELAEIEVRSEPTVQPQHFWVGHSDLQA